VQEKMKTTAKRREFGKKAGQMEKKRKKNFLTSPRKPLQTGRYPVGEGNDERSWETKGSERLRKKQKNVKKKGKTAFGDHVGKGKRTRGKPRVPSLMKKKEEKLKRTLNLKTFEESRYRP